MSIAAMAWKGVAEEMRRKRSRTKGEREFLSAALGATMQRRAKRWRMESSSGRRWMEEEEERRAKEEEGRVMEEREMAEEEEGNKEEGLVGRDNAHVEAR
jgi:hypothetical protein